MPSTMRRLLGALLAPRAQQGATSTTSATPAITTTGGNMMTAPITDDNHPSTAEQATTNNAITAAPCNASTIFFALPLLRSLMFAYHADIIEERVRLHREREDEEWAEMCCRNFKESSVWAIAFHTHELRDGKIVNCETGKEHDLPEREVRRRARRREEEERRKSEKRREEERERERERETQGEDSKVDEKGEFKEREPGSEVEQGRESQVRRRKKAIKSWRSNLVAKMRRLCKRG